MSHFQTNGWYHGYACFLEKEETEFSPPIYEPHPCRLKLLGEGIEVVGIFGGHDTVLFEEEEDPITVETTRVEVIFHAADLQVTHLLLCSYGEFCEEFDEIARKE